jgi:hypothetical protein
MMPSLERVIQSRGGCDERGRKRRAEDRVHLLTGPMLPTSGSISCCLGHHHVCASTRHLRPVSGTDVHEGHPL